MTTRDKRWVWVRRALLACLGFWLAAACSNPEYKFVPPPPDAGPDAPVEEAGPKPPTTQTACATDDECTALLATQVCDAATGYCAECDPAREAELLRCGDGLVCDPSGRCVIGCQADTDCGSLTCDTTTGLCRNCTGDVDCQAGTVCLDTVCTPSCATSDTCPSGWSCCDGTCRNPLTDPQSCGGCGIVCAEPTLSCWNGACGNPPCEAGFAECDGLVETVCEVDVRGDAANCGKCRVACASNFCSGGVCTSMECAPGTADCNESESDHCETDLTTVDDCGMCNNACNATNGTPSCDDGICNIACDDDFGDCDELSDNGCEISFLDDEDHCGDCDTTCTNGHGTTKCTDGACVPRCANGYADCNGDPNDGCETNVNTSLTDCGGCGMRCRPAHAEGTCDDGACIGACDDGFEDCNGDPKDGCEADLSAPETCGGCGNACSDIGGTAGCDMGACTITCADGFADCTGGVADGCETNTDLDPTNCAGCGNVCDSSVGTAVCAAGVCGISTCTFPYEECVPGGPRCETDLRETDVYCGNCGNNCTMRFPHASGVCNGGACALDACADGFADCNAIPDDGCETPLNDADHCRTCAEKCESVHGPNGCTPNGCSPNCQSGWGDCDGNKNNGCETPLNTLFNCGGCDVACNKAHGTESCATGTCDIVACDPGWGDCNNESTPNGCETQLNTLSNCGACGVQCDLAGGTESCGTGTCVLTGCSTGRADCTMAAGCETNLGTTSNCLGCGDACNSPSGTASNNCVSTSSGSCSPACGSGQTCRSVNGTNTCVATATVLGCNPTCSTGYKSCDGDRGNGCEKNIRTLADCGDCGVGCDLPHATESCATGSCAVTSCDAGWFDCSVGSPGCETQANTTTNCSACGAGCVNAHGTAACNNGSCSYTCNGGWDACDGNAANGCETSTRTLTDCGSCGNDCDIAGSGETCATGTCVATTCDPASADCDANGSCETTLGNSAHCRSCTEVCTNGNGTTSCNNTTGCAPVCATGFKSCDSDPNNGCEKNIRTLTDCGDCGIPCDIPNATETCSSGTCTITGCSNGYDDCGNDGTCDPLGTTTNCASCGDTCSNSHGSNVCSGGACSPTCDTGWKSCDNINTNGCERDIRTLTDCGNCNVACNFSHGGESCATGSCVMTGCDAGWGDCTPGGDCETQLNTTAACGSCSVQCTNTNGTTACTSGACAPVCATGFKSCDSDLNNGCERNIRTLTDCGDCGVGCSYPNASASCSTGTCTLGTCNTDYGDCTASPGCETQLNTTSACGSCNVQCTNSNGTTSCTGSAGSRVCTPVCSTGFGNCDANPNNGCEAALNTPSACGACGVVCGVDTPNCVLTGSTYKCQAQITTANDVDGSAATSTLSISHSLQAGTNRLILLAVAAESAGNGIAGSRPDAVTYGGTAMTLAGEQGGVSGPPGTGSCTNPSGCTGTCYDWWGPDHFVYYLTEAGLVGKAINTAFTVTVNAATAPSPTMIIANLIQLNGVRQATPISAFNGGFLGTCATPDPPDPMAGNVISPTVALATTGSRLYSFASALWMTNINCPLNTVTAGCPTFSVSPSMGTPNELYNSAEVNNGAAMRSFFRYSTPGNAAAPAAGTYTPSFNIGANGRMTVFAVAIHPAQQP